MGRDRTRLGEGASHREEFQRGTLLPSRSRDGSSHGDRQSQLCRGPSREEKNLGCESLRLRSKPVLARRPTVKRLRPDADNTNSRRANLTTRNDGRQKPRNLARPKKIIESEKTRN